MIFPLVKRVFGNKKIIVALGLAALSFLAFVQQVYALENPLDAVGALLTAPIATVIGGLLGFYASAAGAILWLLTQALVAVANFNQFVQAEAVTQGWKIIRDVCNMIFVLVLLAIAIGTILQQEKYHYSKMLFPFISAAIFINFSKTICGLIIDASQVIMMTFVGAFNQAIGGNFFLLLGIQNYWKTVGDAAAAGKGATAALADSLISMFLISTLVTVAIVVVFVMVMVLIARVVMLWFLIVLSPFAFALTILPSTQKYAERWWKDFMNHVIVGPAMAFFLWLSLAVVATAAGTEDNAEKVTTPLLKDSAGHTFENPSNEKNNVLESLSVGNTTAGTLPGIINYLLGIGMLMGTLMITQELGVAGSKIAGSALSGVQDALAGKSGIVPWQLAMKSGWGAFSDRMQKPWKESGTRAGAAAGQLADVGITKARQGVADLTAAGAGKIGYGAAKLLGKDKEQAEKAAQAMTDAAGFVLKPIGGTAADRARAGERLEKHKEETTKRNIDAFAKEGHFDTMAPEDLREMLDGEKNETRKAAMVSALNKRNLLTDEGPDLEHIQNTVKFLKNTGGAHMVDEFDATLKKNNLAAAVEAGRYKGHDGKESGDKFRSDLMEGKFGSDQMTQEILKTFFDASRNEETGIADFGQKLFSGMKNAKQITDKIGGMDKDARRYLENETMNETGAVTGLDRAQKSALVLASGSTALAYKMDDPSERQMLADDVLNVAEKRDKLQDNISARSLKDGNLIRFISTNNDWKWTEAKRMKMSLDVEKKTALREGTESIIAEANKKGDDSIEMDRIRNWMFGVNRSNEIIDGKGKYQGEIYDLRGEQYRADEKGEDRKTNAQRRHERKQNEFVDGMYYHEDGTSKKFNELTPEEKKAIVEKDKERAKIAAFDSVEGYEAASVEEKADFEESYVSPLEALAEQERIYNAGGRGHKLQQRELLMDQFGHDRITFGELENQDIRNASSELMLAAAQAASPDQAKKLENNKKLQISILEKYGQLLREIDQDVAVDVQVKIQAVDDDLTKTDEQKASKKQKIIATVKAEYEKKVKPIHQTLRRIPNNNAIVGGGVNVMSVEEKIDDFMKNRLDSIPLLREQSVSSAQSGTTQQQAVPAQPATPTQSSVRQSPSLVPSPTSQAQATSSAPVVPQVVDHLGRAVNRPPKMKKVKRIVERESNFIDPVTNRPRIIQEEIEEDVPDED